MSDEIRHVYSPALGGVKVAFEQNSRGTNITVQVDRPRTEDESYEDAAAAAVEIARLAYTLAQESIAAPPMPITVIDGGKAGA